jgi:hypothetical protein
MDEYLHGFREFSDIQDARPRPLHELELPPPHRTFEASGALRMP